jgi:hypothetical protein
MDKMDKMLMFLLLLAAVTAFGWYLCERARLEAEFAREKSERDEVWYQHLLHEASQGSEWAQRHLAESNDEWRNHVRLGGPMPTEWRNNAAVGGVPPKAKERD